jgi:hypothetical protein
MDTDNLKLTQWEYRGHSERRTISLGERPVSLWVSFIMVWQRDQVWMALPGSLRQWPVEDFLSHSCLTHR